MKVKITSLVTMKLYAAMLIVLAFAQIGAGSASGADRYAAATGFVPYHDAIQKGLFRNSKRVRFKDAKVGKMYFVCNVNTPMPEARYLNLTYTTGPDSRPFDPTCLVAATLKRVDHNGNITNVATVSSASVADAGDNVWTIRSPEIGISERPLDFRNSFYYVILTLRRNATDRTPAAIGVRLTSSEF